jgi:hypothetical protein
MSTDGRPPPIYSSDYSIAQSELPPKQPARVLLPISYLHNCSRFHFPKLVISVLGATHILRRGISAGWRLSLLFVFGVGGSESVTLTRISASGAHFALHETLIIFSLSHQSSTGYVYLFAPCMHVFRVHCTDEKSCHRTFNNREVHNPPPFVPDTRRTSGQVRSEKRSGLASDRQSAARMLKTFSRCPAHSRTFADLWPTSFDFDLV